MPSPPARRARSCNQTGCTQASAAAPSWRILFLTRLWQTIPVLMLPMWSGVRRKSCGTPSTSDSAAEPAEGGPGFKPGFHLAARVRRTAFLGAKLLTSLRESGLGSEGRQHAKRPRLQPLVKHRVVVAMHGQKNFGGLQTPLELAAQMGRARLHRVARLVTQAYGAFDLNQKLIHRMAQFQQSEVRLQLQERARRIDFQ